MKDGTFEDEILPMHSFSKVKIMSEPVLVEE
jgi:hypothetical protein